MKQSFHFHWGNAIAISFVLFGVYMGIFLVRAILSGNTELVENNPYEKGNQYFQKYTQLTNSQKEGISVRVLSQDSVVCFKYESNRGSKHYLGSGKAWFFRPNNQNLDFAITFAMDSQGCFQVAKSRFLPGYWKVKTEWKTPEKEYYAETSFWIP